MRKISRVHRQAIAQYAAFKRWRKHPKLTSTRGGAVVEVGSGLFVYADPEYYGS